MITQKLEKLENLPVNVTNSVTKNEFAKFQLSVARDTALIRVSFLSNNLQFYHLHRSFEIDFN